MGDELVSEVAECPICGKGLKQEEVELQPLKDPSIYVKFDLTRDALKAFPELAQAARDEGANRTSLILWIPTPELLPAVTKVSLHPDQLYVAIAAPTIEGTELWIVSADSQESFERAVGFEKTSMPLLTFPAGKIENAAVRHPQGDLLCGVEGSGQGVAQQTGTGALYEEVGRRGAVPAIPSSVILDDLQESSHLAVQGNPFIVTFPHCHYCHHPAIPCSQVLVSGT